MEDGSVGASIKVQATRASVHQYTTVSRLSSGDIQLKLRESLLKMWCLFSPTVLFPYWGTDPTALPAVVCFDLFLQEKLKSHLFLLFSGFTYMVLRQLCMSNTRCLRIAMNI